MSGALFGALLYVGGLANPVAAQQAPVPDTGVVQSLILTISPEQLYSESAFGQRISREIEEEGAFEIGRAHV